MKTKNTGCDKSSFFDQLETARKEVMETLRQELTPKWLLELHDEAENESNAKD